MELTREEAIRYHREMWNWIADQIEKEGHVQLISRLKDSFIYKNFPGVFIRHDCFCCHYAQYQSVNKDNDMCENCPLDWGNPYKKNYFDCEKECIQKNKDSDENGLYEHCHELYCLGDNNWKHQSELARRIANLPEREVEGEV